jgi:hypothetical protein
MSTGTDWQPSPAAGSDSVLAATQAAEAAEQACTLMTGLAPLLAVVLPGVQGFAVLAWQQACCCSAC